RWTRIVRQLLTAPPRPAVWRDCDRPRRTRHRRRAAVHKDPFRIALAAVRPSRLLLEPAARNAGRRYLNIVRARSGAGAALVPAGHQHRRRNLRVGPRQYRPAQSLTRADAALAD